MTEPEAPDDSRDLVDSSHWRPLWQMQAAFDQDIAALYDDAGIAGVRTRFVGPLIKLSRHGAMTIQELATSMEVTHSAMSQTVAAMRRVELVVSAESTDGRTRRVQLSSRARDVLPFLEAEWRATEATIREIEDEIPYPLSRVVEDINEVLERRPFRHRLRDNLAKARAGELR
jgi:DNA-binding MarR family transcriptional regulator